jgi:hypothetical protein
MKALVTNLLALAAMLLPSVALACANCYAASSKQTILAYYASTMLLSLMPFALIGGVIVAVLVMRNRAPSTEDSSV